MKKNIEWLKKIIFDESVIRLFPNDIEKLHELINQLDEPEVLSQEWVDDNKEMYLINDTSENAVPDYKLQNLLVPKQEELEVKIQELIETYKQEDGAYSNPENGWIGGFIEDLKSLLEEVQKYIVSDNSSIYRHISGVEGTFYKRYRPTGLSYYYIMVKTFDGRMFYAPEKEWEVLKQV